VDEQTAVDLNGGGSQDADGSVQSYLWTQLSGRAVTLTGAGTAAASFTAPALSQPEALTFQLRVTDNGNANGMDTVVITVNPVAGLNDAPVADPGPDQTVGELASVTLDGTGSSDADGAIQAYQWQQQSGPAVTLTNAGAATASFTAPDVAVSADLVFQLTVTDNEGAVASATVVVSVLENLVVSVSGQITFDYVPAVRGATVFLDYVNTQPRPARGVTVQLIDANDGVTVVDSTVTDANGDYGVSAPGGTDVFVRARAEMRQGGGPGWDFRVADNTNGNALYVLDGAAFNTGGTNVTRDLHAASGWNGAGYTAGQRSAAPFAVLDVVYDAVQLVLTGDPALSFPALVLHWSPNNVPSFGAGGTPDPDTGEIGTSFFRSGPGGGIFLLGAENDDTEEYDRHVIAHEWGHYFEHRFSRSDSIGGPHTRDDQLDMRVAFGEGWGNAVSAMITGDSLYKDTLSTAQSFGFSFNVEQGETLNRRGWYNEFSVQEILYDLFDANQDTPEDQLALGFAPIFDVLTNEQRDSLALTSLFPFIDALKANLPASAAAIDALVSTQNISVVADEFGSTEANSGTPPNADVLPIYSDLTVNGGPVNLCSTNDFSGSQTGSTNKLGSRRYLKFNAATNANYTFRMTTTFAPPDESTDPDMWLHRMGPIAVFDAEPDLTCTPTTLENCIEVASRGLAAGDYVLEVYEWTNTNADDDPSFPPIGKACFDIEVTRP
jgi:hypothetical protein